VLDQKFEVNFSRLIIYEFLLLTEISKHMFIRMLVAKRFIFRKIKENMLLNVLEILKVRMLI